MSQFAQRCTTDLLRMDYAVTVRWHTIQASEVLLEEHVKVLDPPLQGLFAYHVTCLHNAGFAKAYILQCPTEDSSAVANLLRKSAYFCSVCPCGNSYIHLQRLLLSKPRVLQNNNDKNIAQLLYIRHKVLRVLSLQCISFKKT